MVGAKSTDERSRGELEGARLTGGLSKITSQKSSAFSVTTATRPMAPMDIVLTSVSVDSQDDVTCLQCGTKGDATALEVLEMPEHFLREMLADWYGAGRAITGEWRAGKWFEENEANIRLHPATRSRVATGLLEARKKFGWQ